MRLPVPPEPESGRFRRWVIPEPLVIGGILLVGTVGTLLLRRIELFSVGGQTLKLAGPMVLALVLLLGVQAARILAARGVGRLVLPVWAVVSLLWVGWLLVDGYLRWGVGNLLRDLRYFVWVGWGAMVLWIVSSDWRNTSLHLRFLSWSGILALAYGYANFVFRFDPKVLTTGGERYFEEDSCAYIAALFFVVLARGLARRRLTRMDMLWTVLCLLAVFLSAKRAVWLGMMGGVGILFLVGKVPLKPFLGLFLAGGLAVGAYAARHASDLQVAAQRILVVKQDKVTDPSVYFRFFAWKTVFDKARENPVVPGGLGSKFDFEMRALGLVQRFENVSPHNTPIWTYYKAGIGGILLYAAMYLFSFAASFRIAKLAEASGSTALREAVLPVVALNVYFLIASQFWDYFAIATQAVIVWWTLGSLFGLSRSVRRETSSVVGS